MQRIALLSLALALCVAGLLAGCGQTGALYLPERNTAEPVPAPADQAPVRSEDTHRKIH